MLNSVTKLDIVAPLSGVLIALESVPDLVFAQKMVGDGISLDPTSGHLLAPVAGVVTLLHKAHHALTIVTAQGIEVLVHIGIDTVILKGAGFTPMVRQGDQVEVGQSLITFDVDYVARHARSLLTQILVANVEKVARMVPASGIVIAGKSVVLQLELIQESANVALADQAQSGFVHGTQVSLPNVTGLHARPAAVLAALAKKFTSEVRIMRGSDSANAKSVVAIMGLATQCGDMIEVAASGPDAHEAIQAISALLAQGCGEKPGEAPVHATIEPAAVRATVSSANELAGVSASPGLAVGTIVQFRAATIDVVEHGGAPAHERGKLDHALHEARRQIDLLKAGMQRPEQAKILEAHQELIDDPDLLDLALRAIDNGKSAGYAWRASFSEYARRLEALEGAHNALLRERASDIRDIGQRVLALLAGVKQTQMVVPDGSILIAETLTPSDTAALDRDKVRGFCTTSGGATSHVAILARSLGIPAICGIDEAALNLIEGSVVVLDGSQGLLQCQPSALDIAAAHARVALQSAISEQEKTQAQAPATTTDGHRIDVAANALNAPDTHAAVANGAEGVGLLRSEFLFDERDTAPSEEEQASAYSAVAQALGKERTLIVRTLDVGGDKPLSYMPLPKEDNPFLGLRGIRVSLDQPEMFRVQLRAILRTAPLTKLHIMFPMIATLEELREAKAILSEEQAASGHQDVQVGIMIEVPSAALMAEQFAREADFFSIGTNDLTQYTLAMDRGHPKLAKKADGLHPSVLKMIQLTCEGARKHGKWVGVCGGMASDPICVPVLIGLGVQELSVSVPAIPAIKALIRRLSLAECQLLAQQVVQMGTAAEVRAHLTAIAS
jgi:phosphoenolpyruvate-protein phosphotransferase